MIVLIQYLVFINVYSLYTLIFTVSITICLIYELRSRFKIYFNGILSMNQSIMDFVTMESESCSRMV
jgi:hypothetical protein